LKRFKENQSDKAGFLYGEKYRSFFAVCFGTYGQFKLNRTKVVE